MLSESGVKYLKALSKGPRTYTIGNSALHALVVKGLATAGQLHASERGGYREYWITTAGRQALKDTPDAPDKR